MNILFPNSPKSRKEVDASFASEHIAAQAAGFEIGLYSHEAVETEDHLNIVSKLSIGQQYLLRGWMMTTEQYQMLFLAVLRSGSMLITDVEAYEEAHYFPKSYRHFQNETAESIWMDGDNEESAWQLYQGFRNGDTLIKDWVKSAKHRWRDAYFIPAGTERGVFAQIFKSFRQARGHLFNRGVVLRRFLPLMSRGTDMRGFPLVEEYRLFFYRGSLLCMPDVEGSDSVKRELDRWSTIARNFKSPFITIDIALLQTGNWTVIEVGDRGVSGLPLSIDPSAFYVAISNQPNQAPIMG